MLRHGLLFLSGSRTAKRVLTGAPFSRAMSRRFVAGESVAELLDAAHGANEDGRAVTANYLGESVKTRDAASAAAATYLEVIDGIRARGLRAGVSLKFTQMGQDIDDAFLAETLEPVLRRARDAGVFVRFDMESSAYTVRTLDAFEELWAAGWRQIGVVLQSYLYRTEGDVRRMVDLGAPVRLCKGAYSEPEEVAYQERAEVDASFVRSMRVLLSEGDQTAIATHDPAMIDATVRHAQERDIARDSFEFQMLHGVRRDLQEQLVADGYRVRVYIPFGEAWYPYLMRRLAERPANVMFMASSVIQESPLGALWPGRKKVGSGHSADGDGRAGRSEDGSGA